MPQATVAGDAIWAFHSMTSWEGEGGVTTCSGAGSSYPSAVDGAAGGGRSRLPTPVCLSVCLSVIFSQCGETMNIQLTFLGT